MYLIVCDTSALLQGYSRILGIAQKQGITLYIPQIVIDELDTIKDKPQHKECRNAHKILSDMPRHKKHICIESLARAKHNIKQKNDDVIIGYANSLCSSDTKPYIVSEDKTFELKYKPTLTIAEYIQKFENHKDNIPTPITQEFFTSLHKKDFSRCHSLISHTDFCVNAYNDSGFTPLILAIKSNNLGLVRALVKHTDIHINKRDSHHLKMTPLMYATQLGNMEIFKLLLHNGACAHLGSMGRNRGNTPFLIACWDNKKNAIAMCELLLQHNISINQADSNGFSGLIKASIKGHNNIADYLLSQGADTKLRDFTFKSAMDYAKEYNHHAIITLLGGSND